MTTSTNGNYAVQNVQNGLSPPVDMHEVDARLQNIEKRSNEIEQRAYAVDHARERIADTFTEGFKATHAIVVDRVVGAAKTLIFGKDDIIAKKKET